MWERAKTKKELMLLATERKEEVLEKLKERIKDGNKDSQRLFDFVKRLNFSKSEKKGAIYWMLFFLYNILNYNDPWPAMTAVIKKQMEKEKAEKILKNKNDNEKIV